MRLWLIRHAHATEGSCADTTGLSREGQAQVGALVRHLRETPVAPPAEVWHSPLPRARQTAETLAAGLAWEIPLIETRLLLPYQPFSAMLECLADQTTDLALVGHEPYLGRLASWLVTGDPEGEIFLVRKGTILCLSRGTENAATAVLFNKWSVAWMIPPSLSQ